MNDITVSEPSTAPFHVAAPALRSGMRLREIDILRGLVVVSMALDHVRDYFYAGAFTFNPLDPECTNAALYATRSSQQGGWSSFPQSCLSEAFRKTILIR